MFEGYYPTSKSNLPTKSELYPKQTALQKAYVFAQLASEAAKRAQEADCAEAMLDGFRSTRYFLDQAETVLQAEQPKNESGTQPDQAA